MRFAAGRKTMIKSSQEGQNKGQKKKVKKASSKDAPDEDYDVDGVAMSGPDPVRYKCPSCREDITTNVRHETSLKTHIMAVVLCLFCFPCVWVPYFCDRCKNANHYCPSCGDYIGTYEE